MNRRFLVVLVVCLALVGLMVSCKNDIEIKEEFGPELVSVTFAESSGASRGLSASLEDFEHNIENYYWGYAAKKSAKDTSNMKRGETPNYATEIVWLNVQNSEPAPGLPTNPIPGFSQGYWDFRLCAYKKVVVEGDNPSTTEVETDYVSYVLVYQGETKEFLLKSSSTNESGNNLVTVTVNPVSISGQNGTLIIKTTGTDAIKLNTVDETVYGENYFPRVISVASLEDYPVEYVNTEAEIKVASYVKDDEEKQVDGLFSLPAGSYKITFAFADDATAPTVNYAKGTIVATVYSNLETTIKGDLSEMTTSVTIQPELNPELVTYTAVSDYIVPQEATKTVKFSSTGVARKVEATTTAAVTNTIIDDIATTSGTTSGYNQKLKLNLNVETVEATEVSATYEIGMTATLTSTSTTVPSDVKTSTSDVSSVAKYVTVTLGIQEGLTEVQAYHDGIAMNNLDGFELGEGWTVSPSVVDDVVVVKKVKSGESDVDITSILDDVLKPLDTQNKGFFFYDSTGVVVFITKSFSPYSLSFVKPLPTAFVAEVGGFKYTKLETAIKKAVTSSKVTLLKDIELESDVDFNVQGGILDLAGYTITGNVTASEYGATVKNGSINGTLTAAGNSALIKDLTVTGKISVGGTGAELDNCTVTATGDYAVEVATDGNATIKGGTYKAATEGKILNGTILVEDGNFKGTLAATGTGIVLKGGTYNTEKPADVTVYTGYEYAKVSDGVYTVRKAYEARNIDTKVEYYYLQDAIDEASDGAGILLLRDVILKEEKVVLEKAVTIDTDGFRLVNYSYLTGKFDETTEEEGLTSTYDYCVDSAMDSKSRGVYSIRHCDARIGSIYYKHLVDAFEAVPEGTETIIYVNGESRVASGITVPAGKIVILELDGNTVMGNTDSTTTYALFTNKGTLTIQDSTDADKDGTGTGLITTFITNPDTGDIPGYASNTITNLGTLTVKSGKIVNNGSGYACYAIDNQTNGTLYTPVVIIDGGRFEQMNGYTYAIRLFCNSTTNFNTVEVNGGVITGGYGLWVQTPNNKVNKAQLTINGGTIEARDGAALYIGGTKADNSQISIDINDGTIGGTGVIIQGPLSGEYGHVSISGGKFVNVQAGANVEKFISGGLFVVEPAEAYIATGYEVVASGESSYPYSVVGLQEILADGQFMSLTEFRESVNSGTSYEGKTVALLRDVDLSTETSWTPIGSYSTDKPFKGTFNGRGHVIKNLTADMSGLGDGQGLFGYTKDASISNLIIKDFNLTVGDDGGILVGTIKGDTSISNVSIVSSQIVGGDPAGGLVGICREQDASKKTIIRNCSIDGETVVKSLTGSRRAGGFVGGIKDGSVLVIENCTFNGKCYGNAASSFIAHDLAQTKIRYQSFINCTAPDASENLFNSEGTGAPLYGGVLIGRVDYGPTYVIDNLVVGGNLVSDISFDTAGGIIGIGVFGSDGVTGIVYMIKAGDNYKSGDVSFRREGDALVASSPKPIIHGDYTFSLDEDYGLTITVPEDSQIILRSGGATIDFEYAAIVGSAGSTLKATCAEAGNNSSFLVTGSHANFFDSYGSKIDSIKSGYYDTDKTTVLPGGIVDLVFDWDSQLNGWKLQAEYAYRYSQFDVSITGEGYTGPDKMTLAAFRDSVNDGTTYAGCTVTLLRNVDLNKEPWIPIGSKAEKKAFSGTFNGAGHVISKLYYKDTSTTSEYIGFFGLVENAVIENLTVSGEITAYQNAGGIVARAVGNTTIRKVTNNVNVTAHDKAGGIICAAYPNINASGAPITDKGCTISVIDCINSGKITCSGLIREASNPIAGGIIANTNNCGKVLCENCQNTAKVVALDKKGEAVTVAGVPYRGYVVGCCTATVQYPNPTDVDASFKAGVYLFKCINTSDDLSYAAIGSANGIVGGLYKIYVKDSEHDEYAKLSDTAGAVYYDYDNKVFHN